MLYSTHIKNLTLFKGLFCLIFFLFITDLNAQDATLVVKGQTSVKWRVFDTGTGINVGVKNINYKEEVLEGALIELKKNGTTIASTTSGKKGKYSFEVPVSAANAKNDYIVYISKDGLCTKMVNINGYVPKPEFAKYPASPKYEVEFDLFLIPTTVKEAISDKPSGKIKWDLSKEHKFVVDPGYAKTAQSEDLKILADPDAYYDALARKRKKVEDALAKKKEAADAKLRAAEEAKQKEIDEANRLAALKAKQEEDRIAREKAEADRLAALAKHIADSTAEANRRKAEEEAAATAKVDVIKIIRPVQGNDDNNNVQYDVAETFSIHIARRSLTAEKERRSMEKSRNLSAKYETINVLTSMLNGVDEYDKRNRKQ